MRLQHHRAQKSCFPLGHALLFYNFLVVGGATSQVSTEITLGKSFRNLEYSTNNKIIDITYIQKILHTLIIVCQFKDSALK